MSTRAIFGDFQTPDDLAARAMSLARPLVAPRAIVEPTVGAGSILEAASRLEPMATVLGLDVNRSHLERARSRLGSHPDARLIEADVFDFDFDALANSLPEPVWLVGNPPWVTSAAMPVLGGENLPKKTNTKLAKGLDAVTGKANFDVAEWILARLVLAFSPREFTAAFLVKTQVARRLIEQAESRGLPMFDARVYRIDAQRAFEASVDACLFTFRGQGRAQRPTGSRDALLYPTLDSDGVPRRFGVRDGTLVSDLDAYEGVLPLMGAAALPFRSGMKHDAAKVFELLHVGSGVVNGFGARVEVEPEFVFPLRKSADLATSDAPVRSVLVPQRALGDDTDDLEHSAPRVFAYLESHRDLLAARRSRVYLGRPRFAVFGIGPYSFAPHKVAVSGLSKRVIFSYVGPVDGRPTLLDDTSYFAVCPDEQTAHALVKTLNAAPARRVLDALVYRESKRPITKGLLMRLDFSSLARAALMEAEIGDAEARLVTAIVPS